MKPVWVIDDDRSIRWVFEKALTREGIPFKTFGLAQDALTALESDTPQVLVSDIRMPGTSGLEVLQNVKQKHPELPVIIMTAYSDLESAVAAFQGGAFEYLPKPFDVDQAVELIRRALDESLHEGATEEVETASPEILGQAPAMQEVFRAIGRLSTSTATVLITGESGTGKELVARALHRHSPRAAKPFIAINTAAMPKDLLESELFGHERGAFTGATEQARGRFELADGGTLLLDEIGDINLATQVKLLRALQEREFERVGGEQTIRVSVRVLSATNRDLSVLVEQGKFREDLFYRLSVVPIRVPALRERPQDLRALAQYFLEEFCARNNFRAKTLDDAVFAVFENYAWPGNARELKNAIERMAILTQGDWLTVESIPVEIRVPRESGARSSVQEARESAERDHILRALEETNWNVSGAARALGMDRTNLHKLIRTLGLARER
jgi:two-component system nitrogen regulation response regulator GlnG